MNKSIFTTRDLPLATFLRTQGISIAQPYNGSTKEWSFEDYKKCEHLALLLSNGEAQVEVLDYEKHRKNLLGMTHIREKIDERNSR